MAATTLPSHDRAKGLISQIHNQRKTQPLSILGLAEPILIPQPPSISQSQSQSTPSQTRTQTQQEPLNPSTLTADLTHYRDLFSKLRFSYLEQVTKEKYLRGIVGQPPIVVTAGENVALEEKLAEMKVELQGKKKAVEELVSQMDGLASGLGDQYDVVDGGLRELETLLGEVEMLEMEVERLRGEVETREGERMVVRSEDERMNLGLEETKALVEEGRRRDLDLEREIRILEEELERKSRECVEAEKELESLEGRRNEVTKAVRDARRLKEEGGRDRLEEQGRWYASSEAVMRGLLGVES